LVYLYKFHNKGDILSAKEYLKDWVPYRTKRVVLFIIVTVIGLSMPFITIDGNHLFLLSFDHKQLHLAGVAFDMQELYLMPFLLMILFIGIFFITVLLGRAWCGWACPQTIFRVIYRDWIETNLLGIRKSIKNKQKQPDMSKNGNAFKKVIAVIIWSLLAMTAAANFVWFFVPPEDFFSYMQNPMEHTTLLGVWLGLTAFLIYDVIILKENFCVYICPYSRIQSVLYDDDTIMAIYSEKRGGKIYDSNKMKFVEKKSQLGEFEECTTCESCVTVCPTGIDIRKGLQLECINCLECVDACTKVMAKYEKPSLVEWSSTQQTVKGIKTNFLRNKIIGYIVVLVGIFIALFMMSQEKEYMLLNINRTTQLYSIKPNQVVDNSYVFLFQNTDKKDHKYYFEVEGHDNITIKRPKGEFLVRAGKKAKKVVILTTKDILVEDDRKDTPISLTIKAYAVDAKDTIVVKRKTVFMYPRIDQVKK
jgi:cytochrome c oxidase accessory protein FixG